MLRTYLTFDMNVLPVKAMQNRLLAFSLALVHHFPNFDLKKDKRFNVKQDIKVSKKFE